MRGDGSIYLRGRTWWATYYINGERQRESLETDDEDVARRKLRKLLRGAIAGEVPTVTQRRATVGDLLDDLLLNMRNRGVASVDKVESHLKAVRAELADVQAAKLETAQVEACQAQWLKEGSAPATVNRRCEALRQAYRLAYNRSPRKVPHVPLIPLLAVENARQGFLSRADFEALLAQLPDADVRDFVEWFWWTGMRPKEIRQLTWDMLDRETWTLHLAPAATKGRKGKRRGRVIPLERELLAIIERRLQARRLDCPLIFHRVSGKRIDKRTPGQPILDFRLQWRAALKAAGLPAGLIRYDLRRSAIRNMKRAGNDEKTIMEISGHRTRSTFDRYNITDEEDIRVALRRNSLYVKSLPTRRKITKR